ncbi:MAG: tRNA threonylcarbamoyladenosine dehydratase [Eggerthellaceae bacterium]|nr:tRNA threonylcarbamoyladenosine dehydratase [Eggerthellaceae bacterium]
MDNWLSRTELLLGPHAIETLAQSHVAVFGIGGVGGHAVEALVRSGVGAITIVDSDTVELTNLNRQIVATHETIGQPKVEVMAKRITSINPRCRVTACQCFYLPETADQFNFAQYDYVVDAVDTVAAKLQLAEEAQRCGTPIISSMGAANKLEPTAFRVADIYQTSVCPLAKVMRRECRKRGIGSLKVVYSQEPPVQAQAPDVDETPAPGRHGVPGSAAFVPSVAGLIIAGEVVKDLVACRTRTTHSMR